MKVLVVLAFAVMVTFCNARRGRSGEKDHGVEQLNGKIGMGLMNAPMGLHSSEHRGGNEENRHVSGEQHDQASHHFFTDGYCNSTNCLNNSTCVGLRCHCATNYYGRHCETFDFCKSNPCSHPHKCRNGNTSFECVCPPGYTGENCTTAIDFCSQNPCQNNGTCTNKIHPRYVSYECTCSNGYHGKHCELINYCYSSTPLCLNAGICSSTNTSYVCWCPRTYTGHNCETKL